jgi:hypothetical protein
MCTQYYIATNLTGSVYPDTVLATLAAGMQSEEREGQRPPQSVAINEFSADHDSSAASSSTHHASSSRSPFAIDLDAISSDLLTAQDAGGHNPTTNKSGRRKTFAIIIFCLGLVASTLWIAMVFARRSETRSDITLESAFASRLQAEERYPLAFNTAFLTYEVQLTARLGNQVDQLMMTQAWEQYLTPHDAARDTMLAWRTSVASVVKNGSIFVSNTTSDVLKVAAMAAIDGGLTNLCQDDAQAEALAHLLQLPRVPAEASKSTTDNLITFTWLLEVANNVFESSFTSLNGIMVERQATYNTQTKTIVESALTVRDEGELVAAWSMKLLEENYQALESLSTLQWLLPATFDRCHVGTIAIPTATPMLAHLRTAPRRRSTKSDPYFLFGTMAMQWKDEELAAALVFPVLEAGFPALEESTVVGNNTLRLKAAFSKLEDVAISYRSQGVDTTLTATYEIVVQAERKDWCSCLVICFCAQ